MGIIVKWPGKWLSGGVKCLACDHVWQGVAMVGTNCMECPECHCHRGVWVGALLPSTAVWLCNYCDCALRYFTIDRMTKCAGCGHEQYVDDLGVGSPPDSA